MVSQWNGVCFRRAIYLHVNLLHHCAEVTGNIRIPETDNAVSFLFQPSLTFTIALCGRVVVVMPAIEFNDQAFCRAEEVHYVAADRRLTPEMRALHRPFFQRTPESALVRRRIGAQFLGCGAADCLEIIAVVLADRSPHPARIVDASHRDANDPPPPGEGEVECNLKENRNGFHL